MDDQRPRLCASCSTRQGAVTGRRSAGRRSRRDPRRRAVGARRRPAGRAPRRAAPSVRVLRRRRRTSRRTSAPDEADSAARRTARLGFAGIHLSTRTEEIDVRTTKKGKVLVGRRKAAACRGGRGRTTASRTCRCPKAEPTACSKSWASRRRTAACGRRCGRSSRRSTSSSSTSATSSTTPGCATLGRAARNPRLRLRVELPHARGPPLPERRARRPGAHPRRGRERGGDPQERRARRPARGGAAWRSRAAGSARSTRSADVVLAPARLRHRDRRRHRPGRPQRGASCC